MDVFGDEPVLYVKDDAEHKVRIDDARQICGNDRLMFRSATLALCRHCGLQPR